MYIGDYLARRALYSPEKLALIDAGKQPALRLTFRQMNDRANRFANWLERVAHIRKGDRVAILARDGVEHLDCLFACGKLGAIHTALNWRLHARELAALVEKTTPAVLLYSGEFKDNVAIIDQETAGVAERIAHYLHLEEPGIEASQPFSVILQEASATPVSCESLTDEDTACLLFTGGTTGLPKGAMISHRMICWNAFNTVIHDLHHDDVYLCVFPLFHAGGLFAYLSSQVIFGNTTILTRQFDPVQVLDLIEREQVTVFAGVPTMYQMMTQAENWDRADLSSLRFCTSGGAPLPVPVIEHYTQAKGIRFKQGFGMTEFGPGLFALAPEDALHKAGSIGRANFFIDVRVLDEQNQPLGPHQIGELVLKGPSGFSGYFNDPSETAAVLDDAGWFHTGDLVYYDEEHYFFVADRKKDLFISGGENVYPAEIEAALYKHPAVHLCAVVGVPDPRWGEAGKACVVLKPGSKTSGEELLGFLRERLAAYKVPKSVAFMESLPLSGMGKVLRRELRQKFVTS
ncbi:MAG: long-chain fatty acid--CoA ligase [Gammaproteobacteria bacterium]